MALTLKINLSKLPFDLEDFRKKRKEKEKEKMMQSSIKKQDGLKLEIEFSIPVDEVNKYFQKHYQKKQQKVKLPGFRPGKIPLNKIRNHFYDEILPDVRQDLCLTFYPDVIEELKIQPAGDPVILDANVQEGTEGYFLLELESHPKVEVKNYLNLKVKKQPEVKITEKEVKQQIENLRHKHAVLKDLENKRPVKIGDLVTVYLTIPKEMTEKHKQDLKTDEFLVLAKNEQEAEDYDFEFYKTLLGMQVGEEKSYQCSWSKSFFEDMSWKTEGPVHTKLYVQQIKESIVPELNDEWAKKLGLESLEELKTQVQKSLEASLKYKNEEEMQHQVIKQLMKNNPIDEFPSSLLNQFKQDLRKRAEKNLKENGLNDEERDSFLHEKEAEFEKKAREDLHANYLITHLIRTAGVKINKEEIQKILIKAFPQDKPEEVEARLKKENRWNNFLYNFISHQVLSFVLKHADIVE